MGLISPLPVSSKLQPNTLSLKIKACYLDIIECAYDFLNPDTLGLLVQGQFEL